MSVTEILESAEKLETKSFERLYQKLYAQRIKRNGVKVLNETESTLLNEINKGFDIKKWERLKYLDWKLESEILNQKEEMESLKLAEAYESYSGRGVSHTPISSEGVCDTPLPQKLSENQSNKLKSYDVISEKWIALYEKS